jgi:uncharacterized protein with NRDE domain
MFPSLLRGAIAVVMPASYNHRVCTLAVYFQTNAELPLVVAANRDEFYARAASPPRLLADAPWVIGGHDAVAGGTWLGVNAHGLVAGILNRRSNQPPDPTRRSRGQLCLDVLRQPSVAAAAAGIQADPGTRYNPFNLLIASPEAACVVGNISGTMQRTPLHAGLHLLTNLELNDPECPRIAKSTAMFEEARRSLREETLPDFLAELRRILADHSTPLDPRGDGLPNNLCVHTERFGTRSSTIVVYSARTRRFRMWHANGPPCETDYAALPLPLSSAAPPVGDEARRNA